MAEHEARLVEFRAEFAKLQREREEQAAVAAAAAAPQVSAESPSSAPAATESREAPAGSPPAPQAPAAAAASTASAQPQVAAASAPASATTSPEPAAAPAPLGLTIDLGLASTYAFRGLNLYQEKSQQDQNGVFIPTVTWAVPKTQLSLSWISAYQTNGANRTAVINVGYGLEQDLSAAYTVSLLDGLVTVVPALTLYTFPFAKKEAAGTRVPLYLEPAVSLTYSPGVDLGLAVLYYAGLQEALKDYRYLYLRPSIGKTLNLSERVDLGLALAAGYKRYNDPERMKSNVWDLGLDARLSVRALEKLTLAPGVHVAWTNLTDRDLGDGLMVWASLNATFNL